MNRYRKILFIILAALQILVLIFMIVKQESILASPVKVLLKCEPIDPRSLFSGDYVILNYTISEIDTDTIPNLSSSKFRGGDTVYVALKREKKEKFYTVAAVSSDLKSIKHKYNTVIRGKVKNSFARLRIRYGVENYFVPQNKGKIIEKNLQDVYVETALAEDGSSAISKLFINNREVDFY